MAPLAPRATRSDRPRAVVVQFPGVNCEWETARVLRAVGLDAAVVRWNAPVQSIGEADAVVIPGGFSYQDRVRAGAIASREPIVDHLRREAEEGKPILGICNGAQVLVEAGLVPGNSDGVPGAALARNRMPDRSGYYTRWVTLAVTDSPSVFTTGLAPGTLLPMPIAHGEGRFTSHDPVIAGALEAGIGIAFRYAGHRGESAPGFPENPNGAVGAAAGVSSREGNVLALMPHPERSAWLWQVPPSWPGPWGEAKRRWQVPDGDAPDPMSAPGPGREVFAALARHLGVRA